MIKINIVILLLICSLGHAAPPKKIPRHLRDAFTLNGEIPVKHKYKDDSYASSQPLIYTTEVIDQMIEKAHNRGLGYYGQTDRYLYEILDKYAPYLQGKTVGIIGSATPWYESIVLAYGGMPITVEYNKIMSEDPRLCVMTVDEYNQNPVQFDCVLSISSLEHDGLGRYGDPINPNGDLEAMQKIRGMLKENSLLILAVPVGRDLLFWNLHRVYGARRLPMLFEGWRQIDSAGFNSHDFNKKSDGNHQPVFVLQPN